MQMFNAWPDEALLDLPAHVKTALFDHLVEPFQNLEDAKSYWLGNTTTLVILDKQDNNGSISAIDPILQNKIKQAITCPEHTTEIAPGYTIKLAILNDASDGLYLLQKLEL